MVLLFVKIGTNYYSYVILVLTKVAGGVSQSMSVRSVPLTPRLALIMICRLQPVSSKLRGHLDRVVIFVNYKDLSVLDLRLRARLYAIHYYISGILPDLQLHSVYSITNRADDYHNALCYVKLRVSTWPNSIYDDDKVWCLSFVHLHTAYSFVDDPISMSDLDVRVSSWSDAVYYNNLSGIVPVVHMHPAHAEPNTYFYTDGVLEQHDDHYSLWMPISDYPHGDGMHTGVHSMSRRNVEYARAWMGDVLLWMCLYYCPEHYDNLVTDLLYLLLYHPDLNQIDVGKFVVARRNSLRVKCTFADVSVND